MRTIDADALKKKIRKDYHPMDEIPFFEILHIISNAPTTEERQKGKWEYIGQSEVTGLKVVQCTNCRKRQYGSMNYCGNCGADMRGDV